MKVTKGHFCILFVFCTVLFAGSTALGQGIWDMSGSTVQEIVTVPTNEPNFPEGTVELERTVLEDSDGDIVFGMWREDNNDTIQNPSLVDGVLEFYGLQSAYIEGAATGLNSLERVAFDFNPSSISTQAELIYFAYSFDIRIEPHASDGTSRLRAYLYYPDGSTANVKSSYTLQVDSWHHVESWIEDSVWSLSLDGVVLDEQWNKGYVTLIDDIKPVVYSNLFLASHPDGSTRPYSGAIDNIELSFFAPECGDWGYFDTDFNHDCYVGLADIVYIANTWLGCTDPANEDCVQLQ